MICLIALLVFGVLGIFSAAHRKIALEAFECVFKRVTLRPCDSGLDKRLKSQITGKLVKRNLRLAKFIFRHFEAISWVFTILLIGSIIYSGISIYNLAVHGNCNGKNSQEACVYNEIGSALKINVGCEGPLCQNKECKCENDTNCPAKESKSCKGICYSKGS